MRIGGKSLLRHGTMALVVALVGVVVAAGPASSPAQAQTAQAAPAAAKVTAWLPYWDQTRALESLQANADLYAYASPFWYQLTTTGGLGRYPGAEDPTILAGIRSTGVKLVPTVTNSFDPVRTSAMLGSSTARAAHVAALVELVVSMRYDGLDVDYESMAASDRDPFSAFLRELASALGPHGKLLTAAVHPKTSEPGTWSGPQAHDYVAIGAAVDRVRIMAYGHAWSTSPAGPIAPLAWLDAIAAFAVARIPAAKVELGLHLYGRDWVGSAGESLTHDQVTARKLSTGASRAWDTTAAEPFFTYAKDGAEHTVFYADAQSIKARLAVVDAHGLAGASFWRLGGEDPAVWNAVRERWAPTAAPTPVVPAPAPDVLAPSVPAALVASARPRRVALTWAASFDEGSGMAGYEVLRSTSAGGPWTLIGAPVDPSLMDAAAVKGRTYWYVARALDKAGNQSAVSPAVSVKAR